MLEPNEEGDRFGGPVTEGRGGPPQMGVQLIERAERPDPRRILGYAGTAKEAGRAGIPGAGVETGRGYRTSVRQGSASSGDDSP